MLADLESLDATIIQFDPDFKVETTQGLGKRGQMSRVVLSILRQAAEPMSSRDVALEMLVSRPLDKSDQTLMRPMTRRAGVALRIQRDNGLVEAEQGPGQSVLWKVAR